MLRASGKKILMARGDYGLILPINVTGAELDTSDTIKFTIKKTISSDTIILEKEFNNIENNRIEFVLTAAESQTLEVNDYVYGIDWYRDGRFMNNIVKSEPFIVEEKV